MPEERAARPTAPRVDRFELADDRRPVPTAETEPVQEHQGPVIPAANVVRGEDAELSRPSVRHGEFTSPLAVVTGEHGGCPLGDGEDGGVRVR
jgi:hypothetical protein